MIHIKTVRCDNTSGYPGVSYEVRCRKWRAFIDIGKYKKSLGYFTNKEDAIKARQDAEIKLRQERLYSDKKSQK